MSASSKPQVWPPLLFPSAVRDGAPQTLTKLFVFGSESSYYNILPTNFDSVCKNYRVYICTPMSYAGSAPDLELAKLLWGQVIGQLGDPVWPDELNRVGGSWM